MRVLRPRFLGVDGRIMEHPLAAAGLSPRVDVAGLARLFTGPGLFGEFAPSAFWHGVEVVWPPVEPAPGGAGLLVDFFAAAVAELCDGVDTVAVSLSGGVDSLAVLWHVLRLRPARRVLAYVVDVVDDNGDHTEEVVRRLLVDVDLADRVSLVVVDPAACARRPVWSPFGPRMDALPAANATVAWLAGEAGAGVLLSGNGADELLAVPHYATVEVARSHGWRAAYRYARDMRAGPGWIGECAARMLPPAVRARAYWAVTWPDWCDPTASPVLDRRWRAGAVAWARSWVDATITEHADQGRGWAAADAYDSWWPRAFIPDAGPVPEEAYAKTPKNVDCSAVS